MQNASEPGEGRSCALVPVNPPEVREASRGARPCAAFLTQLVATREGLPDHRPRRRIEPGFAAARYAAASLLPTRLVRNS